ncbi:MAG: WbqC family protein [Burkholderiaceae bacterium]
MQPYLFPYLGYFQLIAAVDEFVLGDDLQYVKESWINRNRVLINRKEKMISFPLRKSGHLSRINEKYFADDFPKERAALLKQLRNAYANAPCFEEVFPLITDLINHEEMNIAKYAEHTIRGICSYLGIATAIRLSSTLGLGNFADRQDRVIATVRSLGGDMYLNPIGGVALYDASYFARHGVGLRFHRMDNIVYRQFGNPFVPSLSIIDVLMFNPKPERTRLLQCYRLENHAGECDRRYA